MIRPEHDNEGEARRLLHLALPGAQACEAPREEAWQPDLCLRLPGDRRLLVEVKEVRGPRIREVEGQLARGVLELARHAGDHADVAVVLVALDRYGDRLQTAVQRFMQEYAPGVGWGLMDRSGKAVVEIPSLALRWERPPHAAEAESFRFERRDRQLFTDLNRWMLKVLLLRDAPGSLWGGPRSRPRHPTDLAGIARVSVSKAHQFASAFEEEGYLRKAREGLCLVRHRALLEAWLQDEKNRSSKMIPVRAMVPPRAAAGEGESLADRALPVLERARSSVALGGVHAAMRLGLSRVGGTSIPLVHVSIPIADAIDDWQLQVCVRRDAEMILSEPLFPHSVFRGVVRRGEEVPLVDLVQIGLDSVANEARGWEQAEYVVERVLALQEQT